MDAVYDTQYAQIAIEYRWICFSRLEDFDSVSFRSGQAHSEMCV